MTLEEYFIGGTHYNIFNLQTFNHTSCMAYLWLQMIYITYITSVDLVISMLTYERKDYLQSSTADGKHV